MKRSIFKPILFGALFGAAVFFMPFTLLKFLFFFMFIGAIFRFFAWRRFQYSGGMNYQSIYADKIRNMSEEEYSEFKNKTQGGCHGYYHHSCYNYNQNCKTNCDDKKEATTDSEKK